MSLPAPQPNVWVSFLTRLLLIFAAWTLFIKYLFPVSYALAYGEHLARYIYWDLWPLAHVWLG